MRKVLMLLPLESSGHQCQEGIKYQRQYAHFSFLGDIQMLLHIIQEVKVTMIAKHCLKLLSN
jgi:hypothetical protein